MTWILYLNFHVDLNLYAVQTISQMILRHTATIVEFQSSRELTKHISTIVGRVLAFMPLLRRISWFFDEATNLMNLMKYLKFQHCKFKCELNISSYFGTPLIGWTLFGFVNHILKDKVRRNELVLSTKFSNTPLGKKILKEGLIAN